MCKPWGGRDEPGLETTLVLQLIDSGHRKLGPLARFHGRQELIHRLDQRSQTHAEVAG
jgi:hypothetical protein